MNRVNARYGGKIWDGHVYNGHCRVTDFEGMLNTWLFLEVKSDGMIKGQITRLFPKIRHENGEPKSKRLVDPEYATGFTLSVLPIKYMRWACDAWLFLNGNLLVRGLWDSFDENMTFCVALEEVEAIVDALANRPALVSDTVPVSPVESPRRMD